MTRGNQWHDSGFIGTDYRPFGDSVELDVEFNKPHNISMAGTPLYSNPGVSMWIRHVDTVSHHFILTPEQFDDLCAMLDVMRTKVAFDVVEWKEREEAAQRATAE